MTNRNIPKLIVKADSYTIEQVATILQVSYQKALKIVKNNMNYAKVGREYRVPLDEYHRYWNSALREVK